MRILTIILGVLSVIGGFYCFMAPAATFLSLAWIAGVSLVISGISNVVYYFVNRKNDEVSFWMLLSGIFSVIMGLVISGNGVFYILTELFIIYSFALWVTAIGLVQCAAVFQFKKSGGPWVLPLIFAILTVAMGIYSFTHPLLTALSVGMLMGFWIMSQGFNLIGFGLTARKEN